MRDSPCGRDAVGGFFLWGWDAQGASRSAGREMRGGEKGGADACLCGLRFRSARNSKFPVLLLKAFRKSVNSPDGSDSTDFLNNAKAQETNCF